jgi:hypothetical protein
MAISYPLSFPSTVSIRHITWVAKTSVAVSTSPFTGQKQVYEHPGSWWELEIEMPPMTRAQAEEMIGFLLAMNGQAGTFTLGDPDGATARGIATGTPLVNGASQTGRTLITDGWTAGQTGIMKAGDWIQIGSYAYKVTQDANSDGSGNATLEIFPALESSPANNAAITVSNTTSLWRLASNEVIWTADDLVHYGITIRAIEAR